MSTVDLVVIAGGLATIAILVWFFFGPKKANQRQCERVFIRS